MIASNCFLYGIDTLAYSFRPDRKPPGWNLLWHRRGLIFILDEVSTWHFASMEILVKHEASKVANQVEPTRSGSCDLGWGPKARGVLVKPETEKWEMKKWRNGVKQNVTQLARVACPLLPAVPACCSTPPCSACYNQVASLCRINWNKRHLCV